MYRRGVGGGGGGGHSVQCMFRNLQHVCMLHMYVENNVSTFLSFKFTRPCMWKKEN